MLEVKLRNIENMLCLNTTEYDQQPKSSFPTNCIYECVLSGCVSPAHITLNMLIFEHQFSVFNLDINFIF